MAEYRREDQQKQQLQPRPTEGLKSLLPGNGPTKAQVVAVVTLLPVGGFLFLLAGVTLTGTLIGLALSTPLFLLFSPILVPAGLTLALATAGFLTSGAFGITALSAFSWMVNYLRQGRMPEQMEVAKRRVQETAAQMGQIVPGGART
ncbi:Oleosin like [Actinidia chinensis var. chinensis]|uniref:Oleosin n=1 Tax=Actinidia chinensis var. chinensis TaxID=1590841 RepID=A0A2R6PDU0_ACTCC|nr:Oleosin like [Actinidia chinensis var. chinensis]